MTVSGSRLSMRRFWSLLLLTFLVAACSSAPPRMSRTPGESSTNAANRTFAKPSGFPNFVDHSVGQEEISIQAMSLVGVPYRWGGNTPEAGFDCSGLVRYVVDRAASVNLPRTTADMSSRGESIEPDGVAPGDLIFFNTTGRAHSHVGIYVGKLRFVNAPSTGGTVRLDYLTNPYWAKRFDGIRRVAPSKAAPTPFDAPAYVASQAPASADTASGRPSPAQAASVRTNAPADAFEPPPPAMSAAQMQAQAAHSASPVVATASSTADPFEPPPSAQRQAQAQAANPSATAVRQSHAESAAMAAASNAPDPIFAAAAAADAFEPPPPTARLAAQQARAVQQQQPVSATQIPPSDSGVHVMRASTSPLSPGRPASTDDPIAKFANGSY